MFKNTCDPHDENQLAGELLKLARIKTRDIIAKGKLRPSDYDDFASELVTRLFKRMHKWDSSKMSLQSYLECTVRLEMRSLARLSRYRKRPEVSLEVLLKNNDNDFVSPGAELESDAFCEQAHKLHTNVDLEAFLDALTRQERLFLDAFSEYSLRYAAAITGLSCGQAQRLIQNLESYLCEENVGYLNFFGRIW